MDFNHSYIFICPGSGLATLEIWVYYTEYYRQSTENPNKNTFYERTRIYSYDKTYSDPSVIPQVDMYNPKHYNGNGELKTTFTTWSSYSAIYVLHEHNSSQINKWNRDRLKNTRYYVILDFMVSDSGSLTPAYYHSMQMSLATTVCQVQRDLYMKKQTTS